MQLNTNISSRPFYLTLAFGVILASTFMACKTRNTSSLKFLVDAGKDAFKDTEYKCVAGQTYRLELSRADQKTTSQTEGEAITIPAEPYDGEELTELKLGTLVSFQGFADVGVKLGQIVDLKEVVNSEQTGKVLVGIIPNKGDIIEKQYKIGAKYLPCIQGDARGDFMDDIKKIMETPRDELVRDLSLKDIRKGKETNWYETWTQNNLAVDKLFPIRCSQEILKKCINQVLTKVRRLQKDTKVSPLRWYQEHIQGVQICLMGRSGEGFVKDKGKGKDEPHCKLNTSKQRKLFKSDFTRCHRSIFDFLTAMGVVPATHTYVESVVKRVCARDIQSFWRGFVTGAATVGSIIPGIPSGKQVSLDTAIQHAADDLDDRIETAKQYITPRYCIANFPNIIKFFKSGISTELPNFQDKFRTAADRDCLKATKPTLKNSLLCDVSRLYRWAAMKPRSLRKVANKESLYTLCKSSWNAYKFAKKIGSESTEGTEDDYGVEAVEVSEVEQEVEEDNLEDLKNVTTEKEEESEVSSQEEESESIFDPEVDTESDPEKEEKEEKPDDDKYEESPLTEDGWFDDL